jgi:hypothetical protein
MTKTFPAPQPCEEGECPDIPMAIVETSKRGAAMTAFYLPPDWRG